MLSQVHREIEWHVFLRLVHSLQGHVNDQGLLNSSFSVSNPPWSNNQVRPIPQGEAGMHHAKKKEHASFMRNYKGGWEGLRVWSVCTL